MPGPCRKGSIVLASASMLAAISPSPSLAQPSTAVPALPASPAGTLLLERDTLIRLMVLNEVSTRKAKAGDRFILRVDENVSVGGTVVIPVGAKAWGEVISAEESGAVGKSGRLAARLLYVEAGGAQVPLRGENQSKGGAGTTQVVMYSLMTLLPIGLLAPGNNAKLKAGEIFNGYTATAMLFDTASATLTPTAEATPPPMAIPTQ